MTEGKPKENVTPAKDKENLKPQEEAKGNKETEAKAESVAKNLEKKDRKRKKWGDKEEVVWIPKTTLGKEVKAGQWESIEAIKKAGKIIKEPEIIDFLFPDLEERILKIGHGNRPFKWVQRMTDSGRRNKYFVMVAVGNQKGYVGLGLGRAKEYGGAIAAALRTAKLNLTHVSLSCGSWDCGCGTPHSVPLKITGKEGSVKVTLTPAPKGTELIINKTSKDILELVGLKDVWSNTSGHTSTRSNLARATFKALENLNKVKK